MCPLLGTLLRKAIVIPPKRTRYLSEIAEHIRHYNDWTEKQAATAGQLQALQTAQALVDERRDVEAKAHALRLEMDPKVLEWLEQWPNCAIGMNPVFTYHVRGKDINVQTTSEAFPPRHPENCRARLSGWSDLRVGLQEKLPGSFPTRRAFIHSSARVRIRRGVCWRRRTGANQQAIPLCVTRNAGQTAVHCL